MENKNLITGLETSLDIPEGVREIMPNAFYGFNFIEELNLPASLEKFSPDAARGGINDRYGHSPKVNIHEDNPYYLSLNEYIYTKDIKQLLFCPRSCFFYTLRMLDVCEEIGERACCYGSYNKVIFSKSLKRISKEAFEGAFIKELEIPGNVELQEGTFKDAIILQTRLDLKNKIIPKKCFAGASPISNVRLYETYIIDDEAFNGARIRKIYIPPNTKLGKKVFEEDCAPIIGGAIGSEAEMYAVENNMSFAVVDNNDDAIEEFFNHTYEDKELLHIKQFKENKIFEF